jgi:hypothetical protein
MVLKLIACEVLYREVCHHTARSPHRVDIDFNEKDAHDRSDVLRALLQSKIDAAESAKRRYDAVLLAYGLCGNSTLDLRARSIPLVIPRAHDCCTLFLGSKERYKEHFAANPSLPFSAAGYMERGESVFHTGGTADGGAGEAKFRELVERYGEENARYVWQTMYVAPTHGDNRLVYIRVPETDHLGYDRRCREAAAREGKEYVELAGDSRLVRLLVSGEWDPAEFLTVPPGERIGGVYDWDEIIRALP